MNPRLLSVVGCWLLVAGLCAQRQAENWHLGFNVSLSFVNGEPVLNPPTPVDAFEGSVSLSDSLGNLLFYSNGGSSPDGSIPGTIWNREGGVLHDMTGTQGGGNSARQSSIAFPDPNGIPGRYLLFTVDDRESRTQPAGSRGLRYFTIDMSANGGLGDVLDADVPADFDAIEALDATPMADGSGYWVASHNGRDATAAFLILPVRSTGITPATTVPSGPPVRGIIRFSPDGRYLYNNGFVYAFDNTTGRIGSLVNDFSFLDKNSVTFSADSRYLLARNDNNPALGTLVARYEVATGEELLIARLGGMAAGERVFSSTFQLGPNGNVYFVGLQFLPAREGLFEIRCVSSPDPEMEPYRLEFPTNSVSDFPSNPPNFVDAVFRRPPDQDTLRPVVPEQTLCANDEPMLTPRATGTTHRWSTGDTTRTIAVTASGRYAVTVTGGCLPVVDVRQVTLLPVPDIAIGEEGEDAGCSGDSVSLVVLSNLLPDSIRWFDGATTAGRVFEVVLGRTVSATVFTPCGDFTAEFAFPESDPLFDPSFRVPETTVCPGDELTYVIDLNGGADPISIRWFNGNAGLESTFPADSTRPVSVELTGPCNDTIVLTDEPDYLENCVCRDAVPEIFTPNRDGRNDVFGLFTDCRTEVYRLTVFNRWGQTVYSTDDFDRRWDGNTGGKPQLPDVYYYVMTFRYAGQPETLRRDGQVMLVR